MTTQKTYQKLAQAVGAFHRCVANNNEEWKARWTEQIDAMLEAFPHGSGFDHGTHLDWDASGDDKLVFMTAYHHMNENGMYDGWTDHTVTVLPSLGLDFHLKISGANRNDIKDYIGECFATVLNEPVAEHTIA